MLGGKMNMVVGLPKKTWLLFACFAAYFALFLLPRVFPAVGASPLTLFLALSILAVVPTLAGLAIWGVLGSFLSWRRKRPLGAGARSAGQIALAGFGAFALFLVLGRILPSALPTGSYMSDFDQVVWLDLNSTEFVQGDVTLRQKMLAAVIAKLPGSSRTEIERSLGPSLDTQYFMSTGRDLVYLLGPERDSLFGIDSEWLLIWLDEKGIFERYEIAND
jgi:hypothetical protein